VNSGIETGSIGLKTSQQGRCEREQDQGQRQRGVGTRSENVYFEGNQPGIFDRIAEKRQIGGFFKTETFSDRNGARCMRKD